MMTTIYGALCETNKIKLDGQSVNIYRKCVEHDWENCSLKRVIEKDDT